MQYLMIGIIILMELAFATILITTVNSDNMKYAKSIIISSSIGMGMGFISICFIEMPIAISMPLLLGVALILVITMIFNIHSHKYKMLDR